MLLGSLSDWISESIEYKDLRDYLKQQIDIFNPSTFDLVTAWINTFYDGDVDTMIPKKGWISSSTTSSTSSSSELNESGANMEVPEKVITLKF